MSNAVPWCVASIPIPSWASKVFPDCPGEEAMEKLWDAIFQAIRITGDGFLYHMVRILVGTLVEVGLKVRDSGGIPELLDQGLRADSGMTVPAKGLILWEVYYR